MRGRVEAATGRSMRQRHLLISGVDVANRGDRHDLGRVPVQRRERQRRRVHRHGAGLSCDRHRHIPSRSGTEFHGVSAAGAFGHAQRRRHHDRRVVIDHSHLHIHRRRRVEAATRRSMRQRHPVIDGVGVASRGDRHGLGHIPVRGGERQRRRVHRHVAARVPADRHRHVLPPIRCSTQLDAVSAGGAALFEHQRRRRHHDHREVVIDHSHLHIHRRRRVEADTGRSMRQRHPVIGEVGVANRGDRHRARHGPIRGVERQRRRAHRHGAGLSCDRHRHIPNRWSIQLHGVSAAGAFGHAQRRRRHHEYAGLVDVGDRHCQCQRVVNAKVEAARRVLVVRHPQRDHIRRPGLIVDHRVGFDGDLARGSTKRKVGVERRQIRGRVRADALRHRIGQHITAGIDGGNRRTHIACCRVLRHPQRHRIRREHRRILDVVDGDGGSGVNAGGEPVRECAEAEDDGFGGVVGGVVLSSEDDRGGCLSGAERDVGGHPRIISVVGSGASQRDRHRHRPCRCYGQFHGDRHRRAFVDIVGGCVVGDGDGGNIAPAGRDCVVVCSEDGGDLLFGDDDDAAVTNTGWELRVRRDLGPCLEVV